MPKQAKESITISQGVPLVLTIVVFAILVAILHGVLHLLNLLPINDKIHLEIRLQDVLIGMTIYLKTAVDFAIFMGRLMASNPGWKNRIAIEIGTGLGNALGTIIILIIWTFFKEVHILLAAMVFLASLVLFELAYGGLEHFEAWNHEKGIKRILYTSIKKFLDSVLQFIAPILSKVVPDIRSKMKGADTLPWKQLVMLSFSIPFILGLDDFAGYVPLFSIVNVFGFSIGVIAAHTILNIALFVSPETTVRVVKNAWISFAGTIAFILLALWGLYEVVRILFFH